MIEVYLIGSEVKVASEENAIKAKIIAIGIRSNDRVSYEISWWDGRSRKTDWIEACEIVGVDNANKMKIGFRDKKSVVAV